MNKNFKIITINGFRGIVMAAFIVFGLVAGFIVSPAWVCMKAWNYFVVDNFSMAPMNIYQGLLLWGVIALSLYALNNRRSLIGFGSYPRLSPEQIKDIMNKAKMSETKIIDDLDVLKKELDFEPAKKQEMTEEKEQEQEKEEIRG